MVFDDILQKAINLHNQGNLDEAEQLYRSILKTAPDNVGAMHFLAMIAVARGAFDNAIELLYKAIEIDKTAAPFRFNLAMALQGAGFYAESVEQYKKAIELDKDFAPEAYNNMGNIYKMKGEVKEAEKAYKKSIAADEKKAFYALNGLGILYREQGQCDKAMETLQKAIDVEPAFADAYANLATTLRLLGRVFEAIPLYEKALAIDTQNPFILNSYGLALEMDGQTDAAMVSYKKAILIKDDFADPHANLGAILLAKGSESDLREAEKELRRATELDKENESAWVNFGVVLFKRELYVEAMEAYRQAILLNPKNLEVCNNLAIAVHQTGDLIEAAGLCFNALAIDKNFSEIHNTLVAILTDMYEKDKDLAIGSAKAWVKHCPKNPLALHTLAAFTGDDKKEKSDDFYIKEIFDGFADSFDKTLAKLDYAVPDMIAKKFAESEKQNLVILDLGCGTGLVGEKVKLWAKKLIGVDISPKMLEKAKERGIYDELYGMEAGRFLDLHKDSFDAIVAGDVLCYFGKLDKIFKALKNALKPGGQAIFSLEEGSSEKGFCISESGRFKHTEDYVFKTLKFAGFSGENICFKKEILRTENKKPVKGLLFRVC